MSGSGASARCRAGQPFETFLRERIFEPLGMHDTGFHVAASNLDRLATSYWTNFETGALELADAPVGGQWSAPPAFPSGAGGLVSTVDDFLAFGQMMLTSWYADPGEDMVTILMTQRGWTSASPPNVCLDFWTSAYQAIDD